MVLSILNLYILKLTASLTGLIGFLVGLLICLIWRIIIIQHKTKYLIPIFPFLVITFSTLYYKELNNFFTKELNSKKFESYSIFLKGLNLISETLLNLIMFSILKNCLSDFEELTPNKPKKERIKPK